MYTPASVTAHVMRWNSPSQRMFRLIASIVVGGSTADPMLCHWAI
jgi:hypothetical protein